MASILNVDKIRRAAGATDAITIDSSDRASLNDPILFWGELSATSPITPSVNDFMNFNASIDTASGWDSTNKYYVIPKAGYYEVHCMMLSNAMASLDALDFYINKNGQDNFLCRGYNTIQANAYSPAVGLVIHEFAANDQVSIQVRSTQEIWAASDSASSADVSFLSIKYLGH